MAKVCEEKLKQVEKDSTQKTQKKRKQPCKGNTKKKTAKKVISSSEVMTPIISSPDDLIGKLIEHLTDRNNENENTDWYKGLVVKQSGGSKINPKFIVRYFDLPDELFCCNVFEDLKNGDVRVLEVAAEDFIGATISNLYTDENTGADSWLPAEVVDIDVERPDMGNPDFFVLYTDDTRRRE